MAVSAFHDSHRSHHAEMAQMNITPLVDVMLVLLIIFMVATPVLSGQIDMRIPQSTDQARPLEPPPRVQLSVDASGQFQLDGVSMGRTDLPSALEDLARKDPRTIVEIAANADADYQHFAWMLAEAQRSGVREIAWK
ncbi:ExbD/TolR family protein [Lysobacter panacisoli]|uniref:Biopolymer transporter ExbD n=1 Tax=Lysobacter panacisoli TaxID=1255263 RepID=A0ABP9L0I8_9GAMM|nr:biopolymer transporter ExbD [Lysobacter panacisoli]